MSRVFITFTIIVILLACLLPSVNQNLCPCQAQSISDLAEIYSTLSPQTQQELINLIGDQLPTDLTSLTSTLTSPTTQPVTTQPLPHGREALRHFIKNHPGQSLDKNRNNVRSKVQAALKGQPNYGKGNDIVLPEDQPDFWDRVKRVFIGALIDAFGTAFPTNNQ